MNCITDYHRITIVLIIIFIGGLAGLTNFFGFYFQQSAEKREKKIVVKYLLSGIGAAILVPLLLNMLSSNLIKSDDKFDTMNYFVFAGFCFIAGYFSDRFINVMGERILKDLQDTKDIANEAIDSAKATEEKIDVIVSTEAETDSIQIENNQIEFLKDILPSQLINSYDLIDKIIKSFEDPKYKFRTSNGIANVVGYNPVAVMKMLEELRNLGITGKIVSTKDRNVLWSLSTKGREFLRQNKD